MITIDPDKSTKKNFFNTFFIYIYVFHFLRNYLLKNKNNSFNFNFTNNYFL